MKSLIEKLFRRKSLDIYEQRSQGLKARALWENADFQRAVDKVRGGIIEKWTGPETLTDRDGAHQLRLLLKLLDDIEGNIKKEMSDGTYAERLIKDEEEKKAREKNVAQFRR